MIEIVSLLVCLYPAVSRTTVGQLSGIAMAILAMTGWVTMRGISRWTGAGGSYRTVQRFFYTVIPWGMVFGRCEAACHVAVLRASFSVCPVGPWYCSTALSRGRRRPHSATLNSR